ncbi:MAG: DUF3592 domain-containing protein [Polyangiaceae bacterium]
MKADPLLVFLSAAGGILTLIGLVALLRATYLYVLGVRAKGMITSVDRDSGEFPVVTFVPEGSGRQVTFRSNTSTARTWEVGEPVDVLHARDDPAFAMISSVGQMWAFPLVMLGIGVGLGATALFLGLTR